MSLIHNERTKLTANLLNTIAAAIFVTGVVAPIIALSYQVPGPFNGWSAAFVSVIWILTGTALHFLARRLLKGLIP